MVAELIQSCCFKLVIMDENARLKQNRNMLETCEVRQITLGAATHKVTAVIKTKAVKTLQHFVESTLETDTRLVFPWGGHPVPNN
jgi:hypothetical protein